MRRTATLLFSHSSSLFVSVLALPSLSLNKTWRNENKSNALAYKCKSASALPGWMGGGNLRFLVFCFFVLRRCILVTRSLEKHRTSKPVKTIHWLTVQSLRICRNTTKNSRKSQVKEKEKKAFERNSCANHHFAFVDFRTTTSLFPTICCNFDGSSPLFGGIGKSPLECESRFEEESPWSGGGVNLDRRNVSPRSIAWRRTNLSKSSCLWVLDIFLEYESATVRGFGLGETVSMIGLTWIWFFAASAAAASASAFSRTSRSRFSRSRFSRSRALFSANFTNSLSKLHAFMQQIEEIAKIWSGLPVIVLRNDGFRQFLVKTIFACQPVSFIIAASLDEPSVHQTGGKWCSIAFYFNFCNTAKFHTKSSNFLQQTGRRLAAMDSIG